MHQPSSRLSAPRHRALRFLAPLLALLLGSAADSGAQSAVVWDFGSAAASASPSSAAVPNLTVSELTRGNYAGATPLFTTTSANGTYPGASLAYNAGTAAKIGPLDMNEGGSSYFEFTLTPAAGFKLDLSGIQFGARSTSTAPRAWSLRGSLDEYAAELAGTALEANGLWTVISAPTTLVTESPVTLRLYGFDGTGSVSAVNWRIDDLKLTVVVSAVGAAAPVITSFTPETGIAGTVVTISGSNFGAAPTVSFNGTPAPGATLNGSNQIVATVPPGATTGPITVVGPGGAGASSASFTFIDLPNITVNVSPSAFPENGTGSGDITLDEPAAGNVTVALSSSDTDEATVPPSVVIPQGSQSASFTVTGVSDGVADPNGIVTISASAAGFDPGSAEVTVLNVEASAPTVVVNKWVNSSPELVELLVIGNGAPGSTVDMRGMLIKDFSASMVNDGGGKFRFNQTDLLAAVKAGTLIVIGNNASSPDTNTADFVLRLGLLDPAYFTNEGGTATFDLSGVEMVMIKGVNAPAGGEEGAMHTLACGVADAVYTRFNNASSSKLFGAGEHSVYANNSTSSLADYHGTDATGGAAGNTLAASAFGAANTPSNNGFIRALRGVTSLDGVGAGFIVNTTPGTPVSGKNIFLRAQADQTVALTILSDVSPGTITQARITVPVEFGAPSAGTVALSGPGAGGATVSVSGQEVTLNGLSVTTASSATLTLTGLSSPTPAGAAADGRYSFALATAGTGGTPAAVAASPAAVVTIPISSLRDVDATGVPLDLSKTVAIEGVCTEENFNNGQVSGFLQDSTAGMNFFSFDNSFVLVRGNRYVVTGPILQFSGVTEISPAAVSDLIDLGAVGEVAPLSLTLAQLLATPEAYEGMLVKVANLSPDGAGTWGSVGIRLKDASSDTTDPPSTLVVAVPIGSTAGGEPAYPAAVTGIFSQLDAATPFLEEYRLLPRDELDVTGTVQLPGYAGWAENFPGIGAEEEDFDHDGASNFLEYALGGVPNDSSNVPSPMYLREEGNLVMIVSKGDNAFRDETMVYTVESSADLRTWGNEGFSLSGGGNEIIATMPVGPDGVRFLRLKVTSTAP